MMAFKSTYLLGTALTVMAAFSGVEPLSARPLGDSGNAPLISQRYTTPTATSNALPLLETDPIRGRITAIDGSRVQLELSSGETRTYRISQARQQRLGLDVGSEVILQVRRLNNLVTSVSPASLTFSGRPEADTHQR